MGNFTDENITFIRHLYSNLLSNIGPTDPLGAITKRTSDVLNAEWDPAWNVVLARMSGQNNGVVYGYAFRNHWLWYNDFENTKITIIIWKDYHCVEWNDFEKGTTLNTFSSVYVDMLNTNFDTMFTDHPEYYDDIWKAAFTSSTSTATDSLIVKLSTVVIENPVTVNARFCSIDNSIMTGSFFSTNKAKNSTHNLYFIVVGMRYTNEP
jgi:hypothetical protein